MPHLTLNGNPVEMHLTRDLIRPGSHDWYKRMRRMIYLMGASYGPLGSTVQNFLGHIENSSFCE